MKQWIRKYLVLPWESISWGLLILVLSALPGDDLDKVKLIDIPYLDKFLHGTFYFIFTILLIYDLKEKIHLRKYKAFFISLVIAVTYGLIMEITQNYIFQSRSAELLDMLANFGGSVLAVLLYEKIVFGLIYRIKEKLKL
jgi:VanZ family protein